VCQRVRAMWARGRRAPRVGRRGPRRRKRPRKGLLGAFGVGKRRELVDRVENGDAKSCLGSTFSTPHTRPVRSCAWHGHAERQPSRRSGARTSLAGRTASVEKGPLRVPTLARTLTGGRPIAEPAVRPADGPGSLRRPRGVKLFEHRVPEVIVAEDRGLLVISGGVGKNELIRQATLSRPHGERRRAEHRLWT